VFVNHACPKCGVRLSAALGGLCPRCVALVSLGAAPGSPAGSIPGAGGDARPGVGVAESLSNSPPIRFVGDYELLEEIGRGGMGVVYKARQRGLNRLVAVKMILSGPFANEESIQRFQIGAKAAAHLQHPNIVAIHEVGVHEGLHYFSMDYVPGRSLAQILTDRGSDRSAQPATQESFAQIVAWMRAIAEAVQFAHQQGIIHRDLKPSNIVIDPANQPRITDFGLAKRLDERSDLTMTGQVLGAPSYMPPEQASGKRGEAGIHSDVYSLGALFYHLLTGRPPFMAETVHETLYQVLHADPKPPRALNPTVPHDLEVITLKCLRKDPGDRYASASALADDLKRWETGQSILARPSWPGEKIWRWCGRHRIVTGLIGASCLALLGFGGRELWHQCALWRLGHASELLYFSINSDVFRTDSNLSTWAKLPIHGQYVDVSPKGRRLCYSRGEGAAGAIYICNLDGTSSRRIIDNTEYNLWLDENHLVYMTTGGRNVHDLNLETGRRQQLFDFQEITPDGFCGELVLSPDRTRFVTNPQNGVKSWTQDVYVCDLHGGNVQVVWKDADNGTEDQRLLWLKGDRLVWCRKARPGTNVTDMAIVTCRLGETNFQALTDWIGRKVPLVGSPDGQRILYVRAASSPERSYEIWIMNVDGTQPRRFLDRTFPPDDRGFWSVQARWFGRQP
jgi:serine/threonine protein kinase